MFHVEHLLLLFFTIISKNATINSLFHVKGTKNGKQQKVQMGYYG